MNLIMMFDVMMFVIKMFKIMPIMMMILLAPFDHNIV